MKEKVIKRYNNLDGRKRVMRSTIERLKNDANKVHPVIYIKLSDLLKNNPTDKAFDITISTKISLISKKKKVVVKPKAGKNGQYSLLGADPKQPYKEVDNLFNGVKNSLMISRLRVFFKDIFKQKVYNVDLKKHIYIDKISYGKIFFGGEEINTEKATAIMYIKDLLQAATYLKTSKPKRKHLKYGAVSVINLKSKIVIDKKIKTYILTVFETKKGLLKYYIQEDIKKSDRVHFSKVITQSDSTIELLNKTTKTNPINKGLQKKISKNTLNNRFSTPKKRDFFNLKPKFKDVSKFLGKVEILKKESAVMTLSAGQGAGKTTAFFQLMDAFGSSGYKCLHASLEEHPESFLYEKKVKDMLSKQALPNITAPNYERNNITQLWDDINDADVIFIDSMKKLWQYQKGVDLDNDLRKKYNGKLFVIIFQLTSTGKMRGGSDAQFDGDIISFIEKHDDFNKNYMYHDKNRYATENIAHLKYNLSQKGLQGLINNTPTEVANFVVVG